MSRGQTYLTPRRRSLCRYFETLDSDINGGNGDGELVRSEFVAKRQFAPFSCIDENVFPVPFTDRAP